MLRRRPHTGVGCLALLATFLLPATALAQRSSDRDVPARLRHFEGVVSVQRATAGESESALLNLPLEAGDRLWTEGDGRAELQFGDGSLLWLDRRSTLDIVSLGSRADDPTMILRLWAGSLYLSRPEPDRRGGLQQPWRVDAPSGSAVLSGAGSFRLDVDEERRLWLSVYDGHGELVAGGLTERLGPGEQSYAEVGSAPARSVSFNTAEEDDFALWRADLIAANATTERYVRERQYVPRSIVHYAADLEEYGSWHYHDTYHSWYWRPSVPYHWSPYRYGRWVYTYHGWVWSPALRWGFTTAHYGRWHFTVDFGWIWFPGHIYSPAWVHWYVTPHYIGWVPLNFFNRPVVSVNVFVNIFHDGHHSVGHQTIYAGGRGKALNVGPIGSASGTGRVVNGLGYTSGLARAWTFVETDQLGAANVGRVAVSRSEAAGALKGLQGQSNASISGPLRTRQPTRLVPASGRRAVPRTRTIGGNLQAVDSPANGATPGPAKAVPSGGFSKQGVVKPTVPSAPGAQPRSTGRRAVRTDSEPPQGGRLSRDRRTERPTARPGRRVVGPSPRAPRPESADRESAARPRARPRSPISGAPPKPRVAPGGPRRGSTTASRRSATRPDRGASLTPRGSARRSVVRPRAPGRSTPRPGVARAPARPQSRPGASLRGPARSAGGRSLARSRASALKPSSRPSGVSPRGKPRTARRKPGG